MDTREETTRVNELRALLVQGVILVVLLTAVFPGVFFRGEMISAADILFLIPPWKDYTPEYWHGTNHQLMSDTVAAFHPYYTAVRRALDQGEWPLWNDLEYHGMPLLANFQSTPFYPPRLVHAFFDIRVGTTLFIILKLWLCGIAAYACARGLGLRLSTSRFFSAAWMLSSYNVAWCNWPFPDVSAWLPVLFLGVEFVLQEKYRRGFFTLLIGGTLLILAGHPETGLAMCMGLAYYFVFRLAFELRWGRRLWMPVGTVAAAGAASLLVCASVLVPFAEYMVNSHTFFHRSGKMNLPLWPGALVSYWIPRFYGARVDANYWGDSWSNLQSMLYSGMAVWVGVALLWLRPRGRTSAGETSPRRSFAWVRRLDPRVTCLIPATAMGILQSIDFPYLNAINALPVISSMYVSYHAVFSFFSIPLLGAIGLDRFLEKPRRLRDLAPILVLFALVVAFVAFMYWFSYTLISTMKLNGYIERQMLAGGLFFVASLAALAVYCRVGSRGIVVGLLTLLVSADLVYANRALNPTLPLKDVFPETELTQYLESLGPHRFGFPEGNIPSGLMVHYGLEDWQAYDGLYPERITRLNAEMKVKLWGKFEPLRSIPYYLNDPKFEPVIPPENLARMERIKMANGLEVLKNPGALPRAYLVPRLEVLPDAEALLARMVDDAYEPREIAVTEYPIAGRAPQSATASSELGGATVVQRKTTRVVIEADAAADCVLVLSDAYFPGWTATIDGAAAEVFPVYYAFRGVVLPAGRHTVVYTYMPWSFKIGMALSVATLVATAGAALLWLRRGKTA